MERGQLKPLKALLAVLGRPAYGGTLADASVKVPLGFMHQSPYDESKQNDWLGWRCAANAERTGNYCYAVLVGKAPDRWALMNVCTAHQERA